MKISLKSLVISCFVLSTIIISSVSMAQDVYDSKTVWRISTIRIEANMEDKYLANLTKTWKSSMDMAKEEGLIKSYKVLLGTAANESDYNLLLMVENEKFGDYDPSPEREAKWDAIQEKLIANLSKESFDETIEMYGDVRKFLGVKVMREIELK